MMESTVSRCEVSCRRKEEKGRRMVGAWSLYVLTSEIGWMERVNRKLLKAFNARLSSKVLQSATISINVLISYNVLLWGMC